jgi:signal transduction histidine kinase
MAAFQTLWFRCLSLTLGVALLFGIYLLRAREKQMRRRESLRTRYDERERVARDIHDTLLQSVQVLLLRLQDLQSDPSLPTLMREEVMGVLTQAAAAVTEGRERILGLRGHSSAPEDLINSIAGFGRDEVARAGVEFRLRVYGRKRSLAPDAIQEMVDIAREAIRNARRHSGASRVTVHIEYKWRTLRLEIQDNGRGIDPAASEPEMGHFGLLGMRERAAQLQGKFSIRRIQDGGTAVLVLVPSGIAYRGYRWTYEEA